MNRPKYKKLYLEEKAKTKFSYNLLMSIVKSLNDIGIKAETMERLNNFSFDIELLLKIHNPSNGLYECIRMNKDLLEGAKYE